MKQESEAQAAFFGLTGVTTICKGFQSLAEIENIWFIKMHSISGCCLLVYDLHQSLGLLLSFTLLGEDCELVQEGVTFDPKFD